MSAADSIPDSDPPSYIVERRESEQALTEALAGLVVAIGAVQAAAQAVQETGGNAREAFLASVDESERPQLALQWPMFAMMLGLPLA